MSGAKKSSVQRVWTAVKKVMSAMKINALMFVKLRPPVETMLSVFHKYIAIPVSAEKAILGIRLPAVVKDFHVIQMKAARPLNSVMSTTFVAVLVVLIATATKTNGAKMENAFRYAKRIPIAPMTTNALDGNVSRK